MLRTVSAGALQPATLSHPVLRSQRVSAHQQRARTQHSRAQDAVSAHQRAQELEQLSVALRALGCLRGLLGAGCGSSSATRAPRRSLGSRSLAGAAAGNQVDSGRDPQALPFPPQTSAVSRFTRGSLGCCFSHVIFALTVFFSYTIDKP